MSTRRHSLASSAAMTPTGPEKRPVGCWDHATFSLPRQDEDSDVWQQKDAARGVARWSMLAAHRCTGKRCRSPQHAAGREVRDLLLGVLGL
jgi:hypothetical protein